MNAADVAEALAAWALEVVPTLTASYSYPPLEKNSDPPDVVAGVLRESKLIRDPRFPWSNVQQIGVRVWETELSIMADQGADDAASEAATDYLRAAVDAIFASQEADSTLGGRVHDTGPEVQADYEPGFVVYADGSRGREVRIVLTVAEPLEA